MAENNGIPLMSQQQWNDTYGGGRVPPYQTYDDYVQATIQQSQETGQKIVPYSSGITNAAPITASNIQNPMDPGTMDNYNVGAGVALAQVNGDEYYYGYGAADDPHAGDNSTTYIPGTTTAVSTHAVSPENNNAANAAEPDAISGAAPSVQAPENNPDAAAWIAKRKQDFIDQNGGYWDTPEAREQGLANAERAAVNEYNEKYGTEIQGNAQGAKVTTKTYDAEGNVTGKTVRVSNAQGDTTTTYDGKGNVVSKSTTTTTTSKDPNGKTIYETTTKTTDGSGRVTSTSTTITNPDGSKKTVESSGNTTTTTEQASDGSRTETTVRGNAQGAIVTTNEYDKNGTVTKTTTTTSNAQGNTTKVVDRVSGTVVETRTDPSGRTTSTTRQYDPDMDNLQSEVTVSQEGDSLKVGYSSDREGKTNSEVDIDFEKFIGAYDKVQSLVEAASHISEYKNISGVNSLPVKGGGSIDTSKLTSMACMNGACGRGGNIQGISTTMLNVIKAIVAFDDDSAALWDKYNQEKNGTAPDDFGGDLSEDAVSTEPVGSNPGDSGTETATELATEAPTNPYQGPGDGPDVPGPEDVTEATTEMTEEEKMKILAEQLGVDIDELANGAKYITNGEDFDGVNIYYEEGSTTETSLVNRMLNILNTFGRTADDQSLYDADGNKIERLDPNATELTFKYKKDGKEHTITLKLNNELPLEDKKYPGIQVIVK